MTKAHSRSEITSILALRDREGLSYAELSRRTGVRPATLSWWSWRQRKERCSKDRFVEAAVAPTFSLSPSIEVEAPSGWRWRPRNLSISKL
ncbi:MAG: helix-turn-helix transcriptional regulator [Planctomycetota bacterium]